ncbi:CBS domain-containing protein [Streptomyces chartreusis]|uniref:CBS domain-containing protein n=1 Tax=Streptomyces TaxID=1883 RepID=UPI0004C9F619|nr:MULTISPECIES: CBS domain-containing protein [unclassified Streptomyces]SEE07111.1 BON domain-containing protein [Streptomyces sp. PAN_FS17]SEE71480.1 BON domain-containing protein [Streptomyces sp. KS_5]
MRHRTVRELMTKDVVNVRQDAAFADIAKLLAEHGITAVPVVDDEDRPVGVVSEADLLRKEAARLDADWLLPTLHPQPAGRDKAEATTAEGLMTSPAVTARPEWTVVEAARAMERGGVKRLPVVDEAGRLIGVISRADLLRVFLRGDRAVREEITGDVLIRTLGIPPDAVTAHVVDSRVTLRGIVERKSMIPVAVRLCRSVDGVVEVTEDLEYRVDDIGDQAPDTDLSRRDRLAP